MKSPKLSVRSSPKTIHKALWSWLAEHPKIKTKRTWPGWKTPNLTSKYLFLFCPACYVAVHKAPLNSALSDRCTHCPLVTPSGRQLSKRVSPACLDGLYKDWSEAKTVADRKKAAMAIRDLKWDPIKKGPKR